MFMNGTPLLITMSLSINFVTVEHVPTCMDKQLSKYFKSVIRSYSRSSMLAQTLIMVREFDKTTDELTDNAII